MSYSERNGIKTYYEVSGEGFPFVLMHANPFDRRLFLYQAAHFSTYFKVINIDLRAYGYSDKPADRETGRSEEHTSELQSHVNLVCRLLLEKKNRPLPTAHTLAPMVSSSDRPIWIRSATLCAGVCSPCPSTVPPAASLAPSFYCPLFCWPAP